MARTSRVRRYNDIITYDRAAAAGYADRYALWYNPGYVRFGADCANFASQGARAGSMPVTSGDYSSGWWYDKNGTSSTSDDHYSLSWISVPKQMSYWNGRRTDWVTSINGLGKGDFVYYDWSGLRPPAGTIPRHTVSNLPVLPRLAETMRAPRCRKEGTHLGGRAPSRRA